MVTLSPVTTTQPKLSPRLSNSTAIDPRVGPYGFVVDGVQQDKQGFVYLLVTMPRDQTAQVMAGTAHHSHNGEAAEQAAALRWCGLLVPCCLCLSWCRCLCPCVCRCPQARPRALAKLPQQDVACATCSSPALLRLAC